MERSSKLKKTWFEWFYENEILQLVKTFRKKTITIFFFVSINFQVILKSSFLQKHNGKLHKCKVPFGLWCLMPLSTIFKLYHGRSQFEQSIYLSVLWMIGQSNMNERLADVIPHRMLLDVDSVSQKTEIK